MKTWIMLFGIMILFAACTAKTDEIKEVKFHELQDKGGLAYVGDETEPFTGIAYMYFPDGKTVYTKSYFKDGKQNGEYVEYYQNGQISYKYNFKAGKQHGEFVWYNEDGTLVKKANYVDGIQHGEWITYHDNGQIHTKGNFVNGEEDGEWISYDEDGNVIER